MNSQKDRNFEEVKKSLVNLNEAEKRYHQVIEQFVSISEIIPGKPLPSPKRVLDDEGIKEITQAEQEKEKAQKLHRQALEKYIKDYHI